MKDFHTYLCRSNRYIMTTGYYVFNKHFFIWNVNIPRINEWNIEGLSSDSYHLYTPWDDYRDVVILSQPGYKEKELIPYFIRFDFSYHYLFGDLREEDGAWEEMSNCGGLKMYRQRI